LLDGRTKAVEVRFKVIDRTEHVALDQIGDGEEIAIPASVLKHAEFQAAFFRFRDQRLRFRYRHGKWLVDHDVPAGLQRGQRKRVVGFVRRGDDDEVDLGTCDQRLGRSIDLHVGERAGDILTPAAGDARQPQARFDRDQRRMKRGAGGAIADQAGSNRLHG
jgi:hypothetical protein